MRAFGESCSGHLTASIQCDAAAAPANTSSADCRMCLSMCSSPLALGVCVCVRVYVCARACREREREFSCPLPHGHSRLTQNHFASRIALFCLSSRIRRYGRYESSGRGPAACFTRVKSETSVAAGGGRWLRISCGSIKHRRTRFCLICCPSSAPQQPNQKACLSSHMLEVRARRFVIGAPQFACFTGTNVHILTPTYDTTCP